MIAVLAVILIVIVVAVVAVVRWRLREIRADQAVWERLRGELLAGERWWQ